MSSGYQLSDIMNRFPKSSLNRDKVKNISQHDLSLLLRCVDDYDISLNDLCRILDEHDIFDGEGGVREQYLHEVVIKFWRWNEKQDYKVKEYYYKKQPLPEVSICKWCINITEVPKIIDHEFGIEKYIELLQRGYAHTLTSLISDQCKVRVYLKLFDKFLFIYFVPNEVIAAMIHFMLFKNKQWSIAYFESLASDLITHQINSFDLALDHLLSE